MGCDAEGVFGPKSLGAVHAPLRDERIKFEFGLAKFNPLGYLDSFMASEREVLRRRHALVEVFCLVQRDVKEVVKLARRWASVGRLRLSVAQEVPAWRRSTLIAVRKKER